MFSLFKKTSWEIKGKALEFFRLVFRQLPDEFRFLEAGLEKGLYKRYAVNHVLKGNHYSISFDPSQSDKSMIKGLHFDLENIIIRHDGQDFPLNITVFEGLWIGFEFQKNIADFNNFQIHVSYFKKRAGKSVTNKKIENLISRLHSEQLDLNNLSPIKIDNKTYYQIKDLEDGNYLAVDEKGHVFGLIHDPFKVELIHKSVAQFVENVNNGKFNFEKYLNGVYDNHLGKS